MIYRLGTIQDLNDICTLIEDAIIEMEKHGICQWDHIYPVRSDFYEDIKNNDLYVVLDEDKLVAFYVISKECDEQYGNGCWKYEGDSAYILHRFCVDPKVQNKGIGKAVLEHIEDQIKDMGYQSIRLDVFTKNPYTQRLYCHNGYEIRGYADWRKGRFELMEKRLQFL